jgi:hypothetical protein
MRFYVSGFEKCFIKFIIIIKKFLIKNIATENDDDEMVGRNIHREMDEMINGEDKSCFFLL